MFLLIQEVFHRSRNPDPVQMVVSHQLAVVAAGNRICFWHSKPADPHILPLAQRLCNPRAQPAVSLIFHRDNLSSLVCRLYQKFLIQRTYGGHADQFNAYAVFP